MTCPRCHSPDVRRSRRSGPKEGIALRLKHQAPYRCNGCGVRFIATEVSRAAPHPLSLADYLGLRGRARRFFTDRMIVGSVASLIFLLMITAFFSIALGWVDPLLLFARHA